MKAYLRLLASSIKAAHTPEFEKNDLPQNSAQYAEVTDQAESAPESTHKDSLYEYTASKGGISDAQGDPAINFEMVQSPKPNAQRSLNGSALEAALRILSDRLGTEEDDLTKDQENYGTHGVRASLPELLDPATNSTYSREYNVNRNTTEPSIDASSTVDDFEPSDGFDMKGQEGLTEGKALQDGDFDPAGRTTGDRMITEDPRNHGYMNIHSSEAEDAALEAVASEEVEADADPRLWNMANQPLGMAG